jgi:hypothetical protein
VSGRRLAPGPVGTPVGGGNDPFIAPPNPAILASTDPTEVPPPPPPSPGEEEERGGRPVAEHVPDLSPEEQITFASLLTCGRRTKTLHILDHTVVVQTLCGSDDLRIGLYAKPYAETVGEQRAYRIAVCAAGIVSVDGQPLVGSLFEQADNDALFDQKIKIVEKMFPTVITAIYKGVLAAEKEFVELVERLGKSFG